MRDVRQRVRHRGVGGGRFDHRGDRPAVVRRRRLVFRGSGRLRRLRLDRQRGHGHGHQKVSALVTRHTNLLNFPHTGNKALLGERIG